MGTTARAVRSRWGTHLFGSTVPQPFPPLTPRMTPAPHLDIRVTDVHGLSRAYASNNSIWQHGDTLYVSGSSSLRDWQHNVLIPLGQVRQTPRYSQAVTYLSLYGPRVTRVVGHSLGAAVATALAADYGLTAVRYNRPGVSWERDVSSHRHAFDLVSVLDRGAQTTYSTHPHSYRP